MQTLKIKTRVTYDGQTYDVSGNAADMIRYDLLRNKYDLPKMDEAQFVGLATISYAALVRTGKIPTSVKLPDFLNSIDDLEIEEAEEESVEDSFQETDV